MDASIAARRIASIGLAAALLWVATGSRAAGYDPLQVAAEPAVTSIDRTMHDANRQRDIPVRIYLPAAGMPVPVILFSHGLGGSRENNPYLGRHWAARGYVAVFLQHPGSDASVWQDEPAARRKAALRKAASLENFQLRTGDVSAVLDELERWNGTAGDALAGRLDLRHIGMSGHSFGAVTTQAVAGQRYLRGTLSLADPRITAAVAMSPNAPTRGGGPQQAFGQVAIPWLLLTGTHDTAPIGEATVESRQAVFPALPPGGKYELVLDRAEHSAFSDRALPGDQRPRNPNHHRAILAISTAFWDAWLRDDAAARAWLDGDGPRSVLEPEDRWQRK